MSANAQSATTATPGWMSVEDAADYTGLGQTTIRAAINDPAYPVPLIAQRVGANGGRIRIERAELDRWMRAHADVQS